MPDEQVRKIQRMLNEQGYTDKFGEPLKEDGLVGGKTLYAFDKFDENDMANVIPIIKETGYDPNDVLVRDEYGNPIGGEHFAYAGDPRGFLSGVSDWVDDMVDKGKEIADKAEDMVDEGFESAIGNIRGVERDIRGYFAQKLTDVGRLNREDSRNNYTEAKKKNIRAYSGLWFLSDGSKDMQNCIHEEANKLREFDDKSFKQAVFLNDANGAKKYGHSGFVLINEENQGILFSYFPTVESAPNVFYTPGEVRTAVLDSDEVENLLNGNGEVSNLIATDGVMQSEQYTGNKVYDITNEEGYKMYEYAVDIFDYPGQYYLLFNNCDFIVEDILKAGGITVDKKIKPNTTFESLNKDN